MCELLSRYHHFFGKNSSYHDVMWTVTRSSDPSPYFLLNLALPQITFIIFICEYYV